MISSRDRLLASLVALQLAAAALFGAVLVHGLGDGRAATLTQGPVPEDAGGPVAVDPSSDAEADAVDAGTTATGGTAGTSGTAGSTGTGSTATRAPKATVKAGAAGTTALAKGADIKVGSIVSSTGVISFKASAQASKAYLDMVNEAGGVNGHKIVLTQDDDQLDGNRGLAQFKELAQSQFALVALDAPATEAALEKPLADYAIPVIGSFGEYAEYHSPYAFAFTGEYVHYGWQLGNNLAELGVKKPGLMYIDNMDARANAQVVDGFTRGLASKGVTVDSGNIFKQAATDASYDSEVTTFRVNGVDGFASIIDDTAYKRLQSSLDRASFHPVHVATPLFDTPAVLASSTHTEGTYVLSAVDLPGTTDETRTYEAEVRKRYGNDAVISHLGVTGWLSAKIFVAALASMGDDITQQGLLDAVDHLGGAYETGLTAPLAFAPGNRDVNSCLALWKVVNASVQQVHPFVCDTQRG